MIAVSLALALQSPTPTLPIDSGSKVSVTTTVAPGRVVGRFEGVDSAHVRIGVGDRSTISLPLRTVSDVRLSLGKDRWRGARRGGAVGLALGAWFVADTYQEVADGDVWGFGRLVLFGIGGIVAPATGALVGALIPPESWQAIAMPTASMTVAGASNVILALRPEERVRVDTRENKYSGVVRDNTAAVLTIASSETTNIAWSDVTRVRVRGGRHRVRGALYGAAALVAFGIYGETTEGATTSTGERIGAFTGAALVGGYLGSRFLGGRGWISLPLPAR